MASLLGGSLRLSQDRHRDIWFVGERGLFHLNPQTGQITRPPATWNGLSADSVYEDEAGNLWMLADSPIVGLVKYDRQAERTHDIPTWRPCCRRPGIDGNGGSANGNLVADGQNGLWVPSSQGLYYFDRRTEHFTYRFQHDETDPDSLDSNAILSVYQDRGGVLWVGTENAGSIFSISGKNISAFIGIAPATPIASHRAGSRRFIRIPMAFCG